MRFRILLLPILLSGCALFHVDTSKRPRSCRERVAYELKDSYPDPKNLGAALDLICTGSTIP